MILAGSGLANAEIAFANTSSQMDIKQQSETKDFSSIISIENGKNEIVSTPPGRFSTMVYANFVKNGEYILYNNKNLSLYTKPNGTISGGIAPQIIRSNQRNGQWFLIDSYLGQQWIYSDTDGVELRDLDTKNAQLTLKETVNIHREPFSKFKTDETIAPTTVNVVKQAGDWFLIDYNSRQVWITTEKAKYVGTVDSFNATSIYGVPYKKMIIPTGNKSVRPESPLKPSYITVHNTANTAVGANADLHGRYLLNQAASNSEAWVSWHFTVDDKQIVQHLPLNEAAFHAGDNEGPGNRGSIGIEITENADGNYAQAEENAKKLISYLINELNVPMDKVKGHRDWSGKYCPRIILNNGWSQFMTSLQQVYESVKPKPPSYRLFTGGFFGEETAKRELDWLRAGTGWWATYEPTGKSVPYYQVSSGGFSGEQNVKDILNQFQTTTGFSASYKPLGNPIPYRQVMSGSFYGEENIKQYVQDFIKETGLSATYEPSGEGTLKKRIISGSYVGEENVKQAIQQFQQQTGLTATYQPTGQYQEYLQVISGGFGGEENVKAILQDFINTTGISATYEPTKYSDNYRVMTGGLGGEENVKAIVNQLNAELGVAATYTPGNTPNVFHITVEPLYGDSLNSVTSFLDKKGWWYSKNLTGTKTATSFRIVSEQTLDSAKITKALNFYKNHGWWATTSSTGNKVYTKFMIHTEPLLATEINKGLAFFASKGWWATAETTTEKEYVYFNIVSNAYLEKENINKAVDFFNAKHWWNTTVQTGKTGYTTYQIVTDPLLGEDKGNQALSFFTNNHWWAMSQPTGAKEHYYQIVTGSFGSIENAEKNAQWLRDTRGWWVGTQRIQ